MPDWSPATSRSDDALATPGGLRCYACGHEYDYLGSPPHPGRCPACGTRSVSPAGTLSQLDRAGPVATGPGTSTHRVDAEDDSGRVFSYWLAALDDRRVQLVRVGVGDALVGPRDDAWPDDLPALVPAWIDDAVAEMGRELVAPGVILEE